ncbi:Gfo/Idh/MocA family protein [Pectobacterium sp. B1J-3]|uniref:Gfo/Idh/MocA family protein n=1 Tax=Pectobacterium sp. B1J-3 TaxID=3385371 RepID=UPI003905DC2D
MNMLNKRPIGFGLVGVGMIAGYHAKAIQEASKTHPARIIGVCGLNEEEAKNFAQKNDISFYTSQLSDLLKQPDLDVVCIVTPSGAHLEPALDAIAAGKHIIVEKPLEITIERIDAMLEAANKAGVIISAIFQARFGNGARAVKNALDQGRFGRLCLCSAYVKWHRDNQYYRGWKGTQKLDGGGAVMNQAIHAIDLLHWFAGIPKQLFAFKTKAVHTHIETEDTACASFLFENGSLGILEATTAAYPGWERRIEICGELGSVIIEDDRIVRWDFKTSFPEDIEIHQMNKEESKSGASAPDQIGIAGHTQQIKEMIEAILLNKPLSINAVESRNTVAIVQGIYQSANTGLMVIPDIHPFAKGNINEQ